MGQSTSICSKVHFIRKIFLWTGFRDCACTYMCIDLWHKGESWPSESLRSWFTTLFFGGGGGGHWTFIDFELWISKNLLLTDDLFCRMTSLVSNNIAFQHHSFFAYYLVWCNIVSLNSVRNGSDLSYKLKLWFCWRSYLFWIVLDWNFMEAKDLTATVLLATVAFGAYLKRSNLHFPV